MTTNSNSSSIADINKVAYDILKQSKSLDNFPTPVERIVQFSELYVDNSIGLHNIPNHYISKKIDALTRALSKVFGALDRRKKIIYLDPNLMPVKKNFVQLHEVGHQILPWQRDTFQFVEDEKTLDHDIKEAFEVEANFFASATLFQLDRFEDLAKKLPLEIKTVRYLANRFGASIHATMRRYVQTINKRCALIVLTKNDKDKTLLTLRNYFQSENFTKELGDIIMPEEFDITWPFVQDFVLGRRFINNSQPLSNFINDLYSDFEYQYFNNQYNIFVLLMPKGEMITSRTTIIVNE